MSFWQVAKRRIKGAIAPVFLLSFAGFFSYSAAQGDHGLVVSAQLRDQLRQVREEYDAAKAENAALEHRVAGLRINNIDADTLDERAREKLGMADPAEVVVKYPDKDKLF